jgi:hypothetical protein
MKENSPASQRIWNHAFLLLIVCLLFVNLIDLRDILQFEHPYENFGNIIVVLMLLFNHIAFNYTKTGFASTIMKALAWVWMILGLIYVLFVAF